MKPTTKIILTGVLIFVFVLQMMAVFFVNTRYTSVFVFLYIIPYLLPSLFGSLACIDLLYNSETADALKTTGSKLWIRIFMFFATVLWSLIGVVVHHIPISALGILFFVIAAPLLTILLAILWSTQTRFFEKREGKLPILSVITAISACICVVLSFLVLSIML